MAVRKKEKPPPRQRGEGIILRGTTLIFCKNRSPYSPAADNGAFRQPLQTKGVQGCRSKGNFPLTRAQACFQPGTRPLFSPWIRLLSFFLALSFSK